MSNWNKAEVMELDAKNNGGNAFHNATFLANLPEGYKMPMKGCHPNDMKEWVKAVYIDLKYYDANGQPSSTPTTVSTSASRATSRANAASASDPPWWLTLVAARDESS